MSSEVLYDVNGTYSSYNTHYESIDDYGYPSQGDLPLLNRKINFSFFWNIPWQRRCWSGEDADEVFTTAISSHNSQSQVYYHNAEFSRIPWKTKNLLLRSSDTPMAQQTVSKWIGEVISADLTPPILQKYIHFAQVRQERSNNAKVYAANHLTVQEHAYLASIRRNLSHYLTGVLLTKNLYLSVAHALYRVPVQELTIVVGENFSDRGQTFLTVVIVLIHKRFDPGTYRHDIALLRTFEDIIYSLYTKPINLASSSLELNGDLGFVTGWGRCVINRSNGEVCFPRSSVYYPDEDLDPLLMGIQVILNLPEPLCDFYKDNNTPISEGMLCVGRSQKKYRDAPCFAVPGAPLVVGSVKLVGIASWGFACGYKDDLPIVYTDLRHYNFWITHNLYILNDISQSNLTELYIAHRAYILRDLFLQSTPKYNFDYKRSKMNFDRPILKPTTADLLLVKLRGNVTDIRDYISPHVKELKRDMYKNLKDAQDIIGQELNYARAEYEMYQINEGANYFDNSEDKYDDIE